MALPITLLPGEVALAATDGSLNGIAIQDGGYGTVDSKASDVTTVAVGNFVAYRKSDYVTRISYGGAAYYIVPATSIVYIENPLP